MKNHKPLLLGGCWHFGHSNADLNKARAYVDWVKESKALVLLLSDNFENAIPKKGHMLFDQTLTPQEQIDYAEGLFWPIRKQIIGMVQGNHSNRSRHEAGIDMDYQLAKLLQIPEVYNPNQGFVGVKVGRNYYGIAYRHGSGVGSNTFGNCLSLMRQFPSADICAASHTHELATTSRGFWEIDPLTGKRRRRDVTLVNTGSLLDFPSYADEAYYAPQRKGFAILWLGKKEREVIVDITGGLEC